MKKIVKFFEWLLWADYVPLGQQVNTVIIKSGVKMKVAQRYKCDICGHNFYSMKKYPVCMKLSCWWKYY
jgi:transposase-like protein